MNTHITLLLLLALLVAPTTFAQPEPMDEGPAPWMQEPGGPPPPAGDEPDAPPERPNEMRKRPMGGDGERGPRQPGAPMIMMVERWMQRLSETNPEEFARLDALRRDDPMAFRAELEKKLVSERQKFLEHQRPAVAEALKNMSPEDRAWLLARIGGDGLQHPGRPPKDGPSGPGPKKDPAIDEAELRLRENVKAYRAATDEAAKTTVRETIRADLDKLFDLRAKARRDELTRMESQVVEMRAKLDERDKNRDKIIERRLTELLGDDQMAW